MYLKMKHLIKRRIQKTNIWFKKILDPSIRSNQLLNSTQQKAKAICLKILNHPESELLMSGPWQEKRYIKNNDYFIIIQPTGIRIVNHVYSYDIPLEGSHNDKLKKYFDKKPNDLRENMEEEIMKNVTHSLDIIISNLNKKEVLDEELREQFPLNIEGHNMPLETYETKRENE